MSDAPTTSTTSDSRFIRSAGNVYDPDHKLWGPVRWVAQLVQYLVAIILVTIGEGFKSIVSGESPKKRRRE